MDFPESKIRVITLAMCENPMTIGKNGRFEVDSCGLLGVSARQLDWLTHQALNFSDKPDAQEWAVMFISHTEIVKNMPNGPLVMGVLDAFINGKKFEKAKRKIVTTPDTFTKIAEELNFESIHYFTRFFKKMSGETPKSFRKKHSEYNKS